MPGTGERYKPFALDTSFWSHNGYDLSTIAPMGSLAGDFNEDGLLDVMVYFWGRTPVLYLRKPDDSPGSPQLSATAVCAPRTRRFRRALVFQRRHCKPTSMAMATSI